CKVTSVPVEKKYEKYIALCRTGLDEHFVFPQAYHVKLQPLPEKLGAFSLSVAVLRAHLQSPYRRFEGPLRLNHNYAIKHVGPSTLLVVTHHPELQDYLDRGGIHICLDELTPLPVSKAPQPKPA